MTAGTGIALGCMWCAGMLMTGSNPVVALLSGALVAFAVTHTPQQGDEA